MAGFLRWSSAPKTTANLPKGRPAGGHPAALFRDLLVRATAVVQQRLLQAAKPETRNEIQRVLEKVSREFEKACRCGLRGRPARGRWHWISPASLNETDTRSIFAKNKKFEETVAALSVLV